MRCFYYWLVPSLSVDNVNFIIVPSSTAVSTIILWLITVPEPSVVMFKLFAFAIFSAWAKVLSLKSGTFTETLVSFPSVYKTIIEPFGILDPGFGVWSVTRVEFYHH